MQRFDIINKLVSYYDYDNYLEIGVLNGESFNTVNCKNKTSKHVT